MDKPVYLFTGFLESGKTKFIQETLEDKNFNDGESTLLLVFEEGEEEYNPSKFPNKENVHIVTIDDITEMTPAKFTQMEQLYDIDRVMVEANGMTLIADLFKYLPENWAIYQEVMFADSKTFINYNNNMRQLAYDKLQGAELVIFNRCNGDTDKEALHKIVRGANRRSNIIYEYENGDYERDTIQDPLPFDINAPVVEIKDEDYALWYRDILDETTKYSGKRLSFKGMVAFNRQQPKNTFFIGRQVMTCCVEDIQFMPIMCKSKDANKLKTKQWINIVADVEIEFNKISGQKVPVLRVKEYSFASKPEEEVATFY